MTKDNPNGQNPPPPESLHFERSQVKCQRCGRDFEHFMIERIDDLVQLRCGDGLILHLKMTCLHCGELFYWNLREKEIERLVQAYSELLIMVKRYVPE